MECDSSPANISARSALLEIAYLEALVFYFINFWTNFGIIEHCAIQWNAAAAQLTHCTSKFQDAHKVHALVKDV